MEGAGWTIVLESNEKIEFPNDVKNVSKFFEELS